MDIITSEARLSSGVYARRDRVITRGQGVYVWDDAGRRYLDCIAGIGVANVGHCHQTVVAAIARQAGRLNTCQEIFYNEQRAAAWARLVGVGTAGLDRVYFGNSGAEAVETALKFARLSSGRRNIVAAAILSGALLLRHVWGEEVAADRIEDAVDTSLARAAVGTEQMTQRVLAALS